MGTQKKTLFLLFSFIWCATPIVNCFAKLGAKRFCQDEGYFGIVTCDVLRVHSIVIHSMISFIHKSNEKGLLKYVRTLKLRRTEVAAWTIHCHLQSSFW